ncbi:MarR family winged helix-turn-helix transcriptional regulator [Micromonospora sp. KC721]|uniref:MarR family winged helix-turn-helix transcriptional regulator n=1 Tax=Micromonospora sp. KC721 TaxID=2530380 RepID=UPI001A9CFC70|nr:MarR family transcriptional regulator [Micromonospora sp. KC721]
MSDGGAASEDLVNDEAVALYGDILRLTDSIGGRSERIIREASGLGGSEFEVLLRLVRHPEGRSTSARLAEDLSFTSGGLTRLIARMEQAGLLIRHPHPDDRRAALLEPTSQGRQRLQQALRAHVPQINQDLLGPLTPVERLILRELVTKVLLNSARGPVAGRGTASSAAPEPP